MVEHPAVIPKAFGMQVRDQKIIFRDSSMVEHPAVNRRVAGSSPARGAK